MSSKIQKTIKALRNPRYASYVLAKKYIKIYEGFSYDFEKNGEKRIIELLSTESFNVVFDVGANVGNWTKIALETFSEATVHSFELSEETFKTLTRNVVAKRAKLNNLGLSNQTGEITYKDYGANSGVNTILTDANFHDHRIPYSEKTGCLATGGQYCDENNINHIDFLKIDVEGAEHLVLEGFSNLLSSQRIKVIQFEYGYTHADVHFLMKDFYRMFESSGYLVGPLKPTGVLFGDFAYKLNDFNSGPNYVAVAQSESSLIERLQGRRIAGYP